MAVDAILPAKVQQYINEAAKKYSPETVKKDFSVLAFIMQAAVDNGLCKSTPVTKTIRLPRYTTVNKKEAFSQQEYDIAFAFAAHPELPELSAHELRHTRATLWVAQGIDPLMVIRLLGHCDMKMLTKIYDHTTVETLRKALTEADTSSE